MPGDGDKTQEVLEHVNGTSSPETNAANTTTEAIIPTQENGATTKGDSSAADKTSITTTANAPVAAKEEPKHRRQGTDPEAQEMVIASLKSQIQDLFSQVNELNNKLVKSYDRVSDLEDDIHVSSANLRKSSLRIAQLELERTQHLAALNTGLLVEKAHVTAELNRLMEKATEEAAQRGQAETARHAIEKDLDDLSAILFGQANTMVAEARYAQHLSEQKVDGAERALRDAEEMVGLMQTQMQGLQSEKEETEKRMREMQEVMGRGKWRQGIGRQGSTDLVKQVKLLSSHVPYQEFLFFVAHLRSLHLTSSNPPAMATLLPLPFLARLTTEDAEPTVRLDLAPALNWLSRRSVLSAIHTGQLTIEPVPVSTLFSESSLYSGPTTVAGVSPNNDHVSCALCGTSILAATEHIQQRRRPASGGPRNSWSGSFFKKAAAASMVTSHPPSPTSSVTALPLSNSSSQSSGSGSGQHQQVYIFRVASPHSTSSSISISSALPIPGIAKSLSQSTSSPSHAPSTHTIGTPTSSSSPNNQPMTLYPLCSSGWCLARLRATCQVWSFVRTGIVEKVWEEEIPSLISTPTASTSPSSVLSATASTSSPKTTAPQTPEKKPPVPPPRKRGIWGGIASAIGERAASWGDSGSSNAEVKGKSAQTAAPGAPPPLPPRKESRRMPPPLPPAKSTESASPSTPPPLPKRNLNRASVVPAHGEEQQVKHDGGEHHGELGTHDEHGESPSTPTRVVFDASEAQSPVRKKDRALPTETVVERVEHVTEENEDKGEIKDKNEAEKEEKGASKGEQDKVEKENVPPPPIADGGLPVSEVVEASEPAKAATIETEKAQAPKTVPAAEVPLPESPAIPSRVASPAIGVIAPSGTPPPLPKRAAARRPAPVPPSTSAGSVSASVAGAGSRPGTPALKRQGETKEEAKEGEKVKEEADGAKESGDVKKDVVENLVDEAEAKGTEESVEAKEESKQEVEEEQEVVEKEVKKEVAQESKKREESEPVSSDEEFVDAPAGVASPTGISAATSHYAKTQAEDATTMPSIITTATSTPDLSSTAETEVKSLAMDEAPPEKGILPEDGASTDSAEDAKETDKRKSILTIKEADGIATLQEEIDATTTVNELDAKTSSGSGDDKAESDSKEVEDEGDPNSREVYIGDATWEERTWKELVKLREDMFWARVGAWRP